MLLYEEGKALLMQGKRSEAFDKFIHAAQMGSEEAATALRIVFGYRDVTCTDSPSAEVVPAEEQVPPLMPKGDSLGSEGVALYAGGEYEKAFEKYKAAAELGNIEGIYKIGYCYYYGKGVEQNFENAVYWFQKAAEQGHAKAQYMLGNCYYDGKGVDKDNEEAFTWYRKAAGQGHAKAQYNLGYCYYNGAGVRQDYEMAVYWYQKSAEQGYKQAQCALGDCYGLGKGVEQNYETARYWWNKTEK